MSEEIKGWKWLPVPPTEEMIRAGNAAMESSDCSKHTVRGCFMEMSAVAPEPTSVGMEPVAIARLFHETYERFSATFGYETRADTKAFDPKSSNGLLMIAVCKEVVSDQLATLQAKLTAAENEIVVQSYWGERWEREHDARLQLQAKLEQVELTNKNKIDAHERGFKSVCEGLAKTITKLEQAEEDKAELLDALHVAQHSLHEVKHAQLVGADWYTRGKSGLYKQVAMQVERGLDAIAKYEEKK